MLSYRDHEQTRQEVQNRLQKRYAPHGQARHDVYAFSSVYQEACNDETESRRAPKQSLVLVVDDYGMNRDLMARSLRLLGHAPMVAEHGLRAFELLAEHAFDLVLLDIMMPEMDGYEVLARLKADPALCHIPVIVVSGVEDMNSIVRCIELGAEDYLFKPFEPILLRARVTACLEKKHLRDQEQALLNQISVEQERSEQLLLNILPRPIAEQLKQRQQPIAESFDDVSVLFADIVGFTALASRISPAELVTLLNDMFSRFDRLAEQRGLEKIKTIGDAYMVVGGLPTRRKDHAQAIAEMAFAMQRAIAQFSEEYGQAFQIRIGISSGPAVAGVIGASKFSYDLWGDTVNTASRMESLGEPGCIHVSEATYARLRERYEFEERTPLDVKGKGAMQTYFLRRKLVG